MREQVLVPPIVVSSRRSLPQRAPFSFACRYLSPSRPRLSSRLSFRFPFRRRPRFPSYPPPSLRRHLIRRPLPPRAPFRLARRSSFRSVLVPSVVSSFRSVPVPFSVPFPVSFPMSSARPRSPFSRHGRRGVFLFSFDSGRASKQGAGRRACGRWIRAERRERGGAWHPCDGALASKQAGALDRQI